MCSSDLSIIVRFPRAKLITARNYKRRRERNNSLTENYKREGKNTQNITQKRNMQVKRNQQSRQRKIRPTYQKKNRGGETRVVNARTSIGFPDSEITTIRYSDQITLSPGATYGQYTYRGNSCFDPDETGIGHQPMYFDQYAAVYSKYKVISSRLTVSASNYNAAASTAIVVVPSSEIVTITSYSIAMEQPYAKRTELLPISTRAGVRTTITSGMSTARILGLTRAQLAGEDYSASTGSTPSSVWYWNIAAFNTSAVSMQAAVDLEYKVIFYDRRSPNLSLALKVVKTKEDQEKRGRQPELPPVTNLVVPIQSRSSSAPPPMTGPPSGQPSWRSACYDISL